MNIRNALVVAVVATAMHASVLPAQIRESQKTNVRIKAGDVVLAATLYRPKGATGNLPAVVTAHGSMPSTREMAAFWTHIGLKMGFAVLAFDKRGVGESTGTFEPFTVARSTAIFNALASDVAHATRWLAKQPGIDTARIGLIGGSQAGWIMPLAAKQEPRVKFIIAGAGVPISAGAEMAHEAHLMSEGGNQTGITPWHHIAAADAVAFNFRGERGYDPTPVLEALNIPMLWIFGLYDDVIPTIPSIHRIGELQAAGKKNHHARVIPFVDHDYMNVFTRQRYDITPMALQWLEEIGI